MMNGSTPPSSVVLKKVNLKTSYMFVGNLPSFDPIQSVTIIGSGNSESSQDIPTKSIDTIHNELVT